MIVKYCIFVRSKLPKTVSQDPDVINTPLPVEYNPAQEEDAVIRPSAQPSSSLTPLPSVSPAPVPPQAVKPRLLLHRDQSLHPNTPEVTPGPWLHPEAQNQPRSKDQSSGSQKLKNKTKNLWNPTYGSWVLDNFRGKKALSHTQSMPLSPTSCPSQNCPSECTNTACGGANDLSPGASAALSHRLPVGGASGSSVAGMDLVKLQSFPCGNVNYAYDEQSYEAENLPLVKAKTPEAKASCALSVSLGSGLGLGFHSSAIAPKLLLKRHASYGHEDVRRHAKSDKPSRDRDSGFSLSEDLSVAPI